MSVFSSEVTSTNLAADGPVHLRQYRAYIEAKQFISGNMLEIGCGEGRGIDVLKEHITSYTAIDKTQSVQEIIKKKYPNAKFINITIPPIKGIEDNTFDSIVSFQVIEHIQNDVEYLKEIYRILKPGGVALVSTPNINNTLTRNPWHIREYTPQEFNQLISSVFTNYTIKGINGSSKFYTYHEKNKLSVQKFKKFDIFNLEHRLPLKLYQIPYDILNRMNRNKLNNDNTKLVSDITIEDFHLTENVDECLDFFVILHK
ncbi:MAG: class I SAM-dependent methyltransferase [Sphingobacteriales bacterium]|jgi:ubiquinone/menaquinone biosynthesis C-methylase UbiE|nr:MAG: class I SAM-dependent methyltransferase [Sphingobacteriales bacterium]